MVKIQIDGKIYEVTQDKNLLHTCLELGFDIPYFCFHPALGSVGACRQCAVIKYASADDKKGRIIMSCMEPVTEGLIISTTDPAIKAFRAAVIEGLMTNHPHDCPVCDEGGECHLQDMTLLTGHNYRRFAFKKRTYNNQYLGPFIQHEMNRCIQCYRCVRFYRDYAGGTDFNVFGTANHVYFGRHDEGTLGNEFSGNLVEVCPTGVFTDKTFKDHYTRKWDLTNSPSVCIHCSVGCNTMVSERYGMVRRILSRYNAEVNGYFLCDRGRFGYEFINNPERIKGIKVRRRAVYKSNEGDFTYTSTLFQGDEIKTVTHEDYLTSVSQALKAQKIIGIGSPRASLESNFALETLAGKENFYHGIPGELYRLVKTAIEVLRTSPAPVASLKDIEESDAILILGEDITNTAPMMALAVRQAARNRSYELAASQKIPSWNDYPVRELAQDERSLIFIFSVCSTKLDDIAEHTLRGTPDDLARSGLLISGMIYEGSSPLEETDENTVNSLKKIAAALMNASKPLIISGLTNNNEFLLQAAGNICKALSIAGKKAHVSLVFPECNSIGLGLLDGRSLEDLKEVAEKEEIETLIILENDLYIRDEKIDTIFKRSRNIIVLDHLMNETAKQADIIIPAGTFAESTGTILNYEGRAQRYYRVLPPTEYVNDSWKFLAEMIAISGRPVTGSWESFDDIVTSLIAAYPVFSEIANYIPGAEYRLFNEKIARQHPRFSGRTAITAHINVSEPQPPQDNDTPFVFSMEGYTGITPADLKPYSWLPGWNSSNALSRYIKEDLFTSREGTFGVPLFSKKTSSVSDFYLKSPDPFRLRKNEIFIVRAERVFGSEELSSKSRSVAGLIPESFILLNPEYSKKLLSGNNEKVTLIVNGLELSLRIETDNNIPEGIGALFLRDPNIPRLGLPAWAVVKNKRS